MTEKRIIAGQAVGMLLALGVGILIGARTCSEEPEPAQAPEPEIREKIVYRCLPDAGPAPDAGVVPDAAEVAPTALPSRPSQDDESGRELPPAPEPPSPAERRQLLDWFKNESSELSSCGGSSGKTARVTVTLEMNDEGGVRRVLLVDGSDDIPSETRACLRSRMSEWRPPADLVAGRDRLIFRLIL